MLRKFFPAPGTLRIGSAVGRTELADLRRDGGELGRGSQPPRHLQTFLVLHADDAVGDDEASQAFGSRERVVDGDDAAGGGADEVEALEAQVLDKRFKLFRGNSVIASVVGDKAIARAGDGGDLVLPHARAARARVQENHRRPLAAALAAAVLVPHPAAGKLRVSHFLYFAVVSAAQGGAECPIRPRRRAHWSRSSARWTPSPSGAAASSAGSSSRWSPPSPTRCSRATHSTRRPSGPTTWPTCSTARTSCSAPPTRCTRAATSAPMSSTRPGRRARAGWSTPRSTSFSSSRGWRSSCGWACRRRCIPGTSA